LKFVTNNYIIIIKFGIKKSICGMREYT